MSAKVSERAFQNQVVSLAKTCGWRVAHFRPAMMQSGKWATAMIGDSGWPDLAMAHSARGDRPARLILAELKSETGRVAEAQKEWLAVLSQVAGDVLVRIWTPRDWAEINKELVG